MAGYKLRLAAVEVVVGSDVVACIVPVAETHYSELVVSGVVAKHVVAIVRVPGDEGYSELYEVVYCSPNVMFDCFVEKSVLAPFL